MWAVLGLCVPGCCGDVALRRFICGPSKHRETELDECWLKLAYERDAVEVLRLVKGALGGAAARNCNNNNKTPTNNQQNRLLLK